MVVTVNIHLPEKAIIFFTPPSCVERGSLAALSCINDIIVYSACSHVTRIYIYGIVWVVVLLLLTVLQTARLRTHHIFHFHSGFMHNMNQQQLRNSY